MTRDDARSFPAPFLPAADRNSLESMNDLTSVESTGWARTARRQQRIAGVLARRQPTLTIVLEDVHDPHNASAVLRSCDATGVLGAHLVYVHDRPPVKAFNRTTSASSAKWVETTFHNSPSECIQDLHSQGFQVLAVALAEGAISMYDVDFTQPTALVLGNEMRGVSDEMIAFADAVIRIPMQGLVESLNISVACAVTLYEAMRQRLIAGMYDEPQMDDEKRGIIEADWLKR